MNNSNIINKIAEHYNLSYLVEKGKGKGKGSGKDDSQHGEDIREHHHELEQVLIIILFIISLLLS